SADKIFERRWALMLLDVVMARLRDEFLLDGKELLFDAIKPCLAGSRESQPYAEIAAKLAMTEGAVKIAVHRMRQRYRELLRAEVAQTVTRPDEVDEELRYLMTALSSS